MSGIVSQIDTSGFKVIKIEMSNIHLKLCRWLLTGWPCQYCSFNCYWQGHPVKSAFRTTADRVTSSITVETAVLTGSLSQYCINKHCWQGDPVNSEHLCIIDRVTMKAVHQNMFLTGWIKTNQELRNATNQSMSYIGFTLTGSPCQKWFLMSYWQGHLVSSGCWCIVERATLSAVGVDVLLRRWPCQ